MNPPAYTLRVTNQDVLDDLASMTKEIQSIKDEQFNKRTRNPGAQVPLDLLLSIWKSFGPEEKCDLVRGFKTRVMGYQYSLKSNPGQWVKGFKAKRGSEVDLSV